jgi:hypothetical protein
LQNRQLLRIVRPMNLQEFLKKENQNIKLVDKKLEKFHRIFYGILRITASGGLRFFEIINNSLKSYCEGLQEYSSDPILKQGDRCDLISS